MPTIPISPNMNLALPIPTETQGPQYAEYITNNFSIIDNHNHTPGNGNLIPVSGLSINADLPMNNYGVLNTKNVSLVNQLSAPSANGSLYMTGNNLYWKSGTGAFTVQITNNGSVNAASGSITGLVSPASAVYNSVPGVVVFQSNTNLGANLDCRNLTLRNNVVSSPAYEVLAPTLTGAQSVTMPLIPASTKIMSMTNAGVMAAVVDVDNSTLEISTNTLQVKDSGISTNKLANLSVATGKIADGAVTREKLGALGQQISLSCGTFSTSSLTTVNVTNLSVTITTTGRPVMIQLIADQSGVSGYIRAERSGTTTLGTVYIQRSGWTQDLVGYQVGCAGASANLSVTVPVSSVTYIDAPVAGTYIYSIGAQAGLGNTITIRNAQLVVFEL